jgi:restriction system protein
MPTRVWVIRAGKGGKYADLFWARSIVALAVDFRADASEATAAGLTEAGVAAGNAPPVAALLRRFALELEVGDVVVCPVSGQKRYMIGRVASDYRFVDDEGDTGLHHLRSVTWQGELTASDLPLNLRRTLGSPMMLYLPAAQEQLMSHVMGSGALR